MLKTVCKNQNKRKALGVVILAAVAVTFFGAMWYTIGVLSFVVIGISALFTALIAAGLYLVIE